MEYAPLSNLNFKTPEDEIKFLKEQVALREEELTNKGHRQYKDDVVAEEISRYKDRVSSDVLHTNYEIGEKKINEIVLNLAPESHDEKMSEMISIMQGKGVKNALSVLKAMHDPHLEDDFHRMLVQYIQGDFPVRSITKELEKSSKFVLYEVILPESGEGKERPLKEIFSAMEQFFSGMTSVNSSSEKDNYYSIEIANANGSDQFVFYVSVPVSKKDLFEKQITSLFPTVKLSYEPNDYNVFNEEGVSLGAYLTTIENAIIPIKTYNDFDLDPLNVILNSFSKIKKVGEGAAIQFIIKPVGDSYNHKYKSVLEKVEKGTPLKEALKDSFVAEFGKVLKDLFMPKKSDAEGEKKDEKKVDQDQVSGIKKKMSDLVLLTNIRLVTSGNSRQEAEKILSEIESGFNQFSIVNQNSLKFEKLSKGTLEKLFREFSFRIFRDDVKLPLNLKELAALIHFPQTSYLLQPQLKSASAVSAPAPQEMSKDGTVLGKNNFRGAEMVVTMTDEDRLRHLYTIGQTGTGKTTLMKNMIVQDMKAGKGVCYIDPHGSDILDVLANVPKDRIDDVIYFDPSYVDRPMALNMLEYDRSHPEQKTFVVNELFSIFQKLYGAVPESMGPMFEQYFRNATMLVIEDPDTGSTLLDVSRVMANKKFRDLKISRCKNPVVVEFWKEVAEKAGGEASLANIVPYITSKFDVFLANDVMRPLIAQEKSSFNFREIMDNKKILLVNLAKGRLGDINANLIGLILVGKILMAALSRVDSIDKGFPPFYLYIDEFQNITTNSIATILSEARKYKLSLSIAHQFIAQLQQNIKDAVFGNVGSIVSFRISSEDAGYLEKQFSPVFSVKDLMNVDNRNALVKMLVNGKPAKPFNIATLPPPAGDPSIVDSLKHLSYLKFGGDREAIEAEIMKKYQK
jgi:hypothetical protein